MYLTSSSFKNLVFKVFVILLINLKKDKSYNKRITRNKVILKGFQGQLRMYTT
jgi:hypothetical protein